MILFDVLGRLRTREAIFSVGFQIEQCDRKNLDAIIVGPGRDKGLVRKKLGRVL